MNLMGQKFNETVNIFPRLTLSPWIIVLIFVLFFTCFLKITLFWTLGNFTLGYSSSTDENISISLLEAINPHRSGLSKDNSTRSNYNLICYYTINNDFWQLNPNAIDPYLCTHIIVGFALISNGSLLPSDPGDLKIYETVLSLKKINSELKILLSVLDQSTNGFADVVATEMMRKSFVKLSLDFIKKYNFSGLDLDWEFPSWPKNNPEQRNNFTLLLKDFRSEITTNKSGLILSAAVASPKTIMMQSYDIPAMAKYLDFVNLMSYDYHQYSNLLPVTGPNAPLYASALETGILASLNTNWSASYWVQWGMPKKKINIGIPIYGHSYTLTNEDNTGWYAPANGFGELGQQGFVSWFETCHFISDPNTMHFFDDEYQVPYAYRNKEWISYENERSVYFKGNYIKDNHFGGGMIFSLNNDDWKGICGGQNFPQTRLISNILTSK